MPDTAVDHKNMLWSKPYVESIRLITNLDIQMGAARALDPRTDDSSVKEQRQRVEDRPVMTESSLHGELERISYRLQLP